MQYKYRTISEQSEGIYKEKGSKFFAFAEPVSSKAEAEERIRWYKKEYYDARHVCYAYMIGAERDVYRANDDGEPSGTAGRPILGQIESKGLTNILVVVVRYFGGILLGTGGLIVAYREATADAISNAQIVEKDVMIDRELHFPYEQMNQIMRTLKDIGAQIIKQDYENDNCIITCQIKKEYEGRI